MAKSTRDLAIPIPVASAKPVPHSQGRRWKKIGFRVTLSALVGLALISTFKKGQHPRRQHPKLNATDIENIYLSISNGQSALEASRKLASHPHLAGSAQDLENAKVVLDIFQTELGIRKPKEMPIFQAGSLPSRHSILGLTNKLLPWKWPNAWIDTYYPVLNTPLERSLEIIGKDGNVYWSADLEEDGDPVDEDAAKYRVAVPAWHGYSADGDVTGKLIFANYGTREDYQELQGKGVDFTGKIVLVRYGNIMRGLKIKMAEELGAVGVLIYSDPSDDGHITVENGYLPYPLGPARNPSSVQRGSVEYISIYPGDPSTPGYPAYKDAPRQEPTNLAKIPSLPISWANAQVLLKELKGDDDSGDVLPDARVLNGRASKRSVRLVNHVETKVAPIWNAMATIPGHISDEVVLIGGHRDAWVLGAVDPISGTVSILELVRGLGELLRKGWRPLRTIVIASWDAEEYGLVGSTEWGEDFKDWISKHVVTYINVDVSSGGSVWLPEGSPSLTHLIRRAAMDVPHPTRPNETLWDARNDEGPYKNDTQVVNSATEGPIQSRYARTFHQDKHKRKADLGMVHLGSGSDYATFLQHIGVASMDQSFSPTISDAVYHYHSIYDSQRWEEVYGDPTFSRHVAVAKHMGLTALRLADAIILPLNTTQYALELDNYLDTANHAALKDHKPDFSTLRHSIKKLQKASIALDEEKEEAERKFKEILRRFARERCANKDGRFWRSIKSHFARAWDVFTGYPRHYDLDSLKNAERVLGIADRILDHDVSQWPFPIRKFIRAAKRVQQANKKLINFERGFISKEGLPDRTWYKHLVVAPGKWDGYGATTLPALNEAIAEKEDDGRIQHEIERLVELIDKLAEMIEP